MAIVVSTAIDVEVKPTKDQLWGLAHLFQANWRTAPQVFSGFSTGIDHALSASEQRWGRYRGPLRTVQALVTAWGEEAPRKVVSFFMRNAQARLLQPLWPDQVKITATPTVTNLPCDPNDRRFFVNQYVAVLKFDNHGFSSEFEVTTITAVNAGSIDVVALSSITPAIGYKIYPLIEAKLKLRQSGGMITDQALDIAITSRETVGQMALPIEATVSIGTNPPGQQVFDSLPVWNFTAEPSSVRRGTVRRGSEANVGLGSTNEVEGDRGLHTYEASYRWKNRAKFGEIRRFFESRAGRLEPFYFVSPLTEMVVEGFTNTTIAVRSIGPEIDWDFYSHVAVIKKDGEIIIKEIVSVNRVSDTDTLTVAAFSVTPTLSDTRRVTSAQKVRFDTDEMSETWITDDKGETFFSFVEVDFEQSVSIPDLEEVLESAQGLFGQSVGMFPGGWMFPGFRHDTPFMQRTDTLGRRDFFWRATKNFTFKSFFVSQTTNSAGSIENITRGLGPDFMTFGTPIGDYTHEIILPGLDTMEVRKGDLMRFETGGNGALTGPDGGTSWPRGMPYYERFSGGGFSMRGGDHLQTVIKDNAGNLIQQMFTSPFGDTTTDKLFTGFDGLGIRMTPPFGLTVMGMYFVDVGDFNVGTALDITIKIDITGGGNVATGRFNADEFFASEPGNPFFIMFDDDVFLDPSIEYDCYLDLSNMDAAHTTAKVRTFTLDTIFASDPVAKANAAPWGITDIKPIEAATIPTWTVLTDEWVNIGLVVRTIGAQ